MQFGNLRPNSACSRLPRREVSSRPFPSRNRSVGHQMELRSNSDFGDFSRIRQSEDVQGAKGFARRFPQRYRVDNFCCIAYTHAVVFRPSGLVVKGKSSGPGTKKQGTGQVKSGRNGAPAPQSRASLSAVRRCSSLLGVKRQRGVPGSSFRFGDLFCSCTRRILRG